MIGLIRPIRPISLISSLFLFLASCFIAVIDSGLIHALLDAAVFHKVILQTVDEFAQHVVLLMDERDGNICNRLGTARFYRIPVKCAVIMLGAHLAGLHTARVIGGPLLQIPHP